jgi:hypothetical protein
VWIKGYLADKFAILVGCIGISLVVIYHQREAWRLLRTIFVEMPVAG